MKNIKAKIDYSAKIFEKTTSSFKIKETFVYKMIVSGLVFLRGRLKYYDNMTLRSLDDETLGYMDTLNEGGTK